VQAKEKCKNKRAKTSGYLANCPGAKEQSSFAILGFCFKNDKHIFISLLKTCLAHLLMASLFSAIKKMQEKCFCHTVKPQCIFFPHTIKHQPIPLQISYQAVLCSSEQSKGQIKRAGNNLSQP
jgi:hypothetical protein